MRRLGLPLLVLGTFVLQAPAQGLWSAAPSGTATIGATTMVNASSFGARCSLEGDRNSTVTLMWTPSTSAFVTGYEIIRISSSDGPQTPLAVAGRGTATYEDKPTISGNGVAYTYTIRATSPTNWRVPAVAATTNPAWTPKCQTR